jgi:hypothetical protein
MDKRTEYPDAEHILIDLDTVKLYASQAKSPYVGIPVVTDGSRPPAIFLRRILQAAVSAPGHVTALYDATEKTLLLNGGGRSRYLLKDQLAQGTHWQIVEQIRRWAHSQQSSKAARERNKAAGPMAPKARQTRELIAKLERRAAKIRLDRPPNPVVPEDYALEPASEWERERFVRWYAERPIREALSRFLAKGTAKNGRTWAEFYTEVSKVIGRTVPESNYYSRLKTLKRYKGVMGLTWEMYWKGLPHYLGMQLKPFDAKEQKGWFHAPERRTEYCTAVRAKREIEGQIESLQGLLAIYERELSAVESTEAEVIS